MHRGHRYKDARRPSASVKRWEKTIRFKMLNQRKAPVMSVLKPLNEAEWYFHRCIAPQLPSAVPQLLWSKRFERSGFMVLEFEPLASFAPHLTGPFSADWLSHVPERLGALIVDILLVIDSLARLGWSQGNVSQRSIGYSRKSHCWMLNRFEYVQAISSSGETTKWDLYELAMIVTNIIDNGVRQILKSSPLYTSKLDELVAVAELLKTGPSLSTALESVHSFYQQYRNCSKWDVKFQKNRFRRLGAALELHGKHIQP